MFLNALHIQNTATVYKFNKDDLKKKREKEIKNPANWMHDELCISVLGIWKWFAVHVAGPMHCCRLSRRVGVATLRLALPLLLLLLLLPFHFVLHFHFLISCLFSLLIPGFFGKFTTNCVCVVNSKNSQEESIRKVNKIFIFSIAKHVWHTVLYNITETEIIIELGNSIRLIWVQGTVEVTEYIENMYILCVLYN